MSRKHPAYQICRRVLDISPYTNEPVEELEIIRELPHPVSDQELNAVRAQYQDNSIWVQQSTMWS